MKLRLSKSWFAKRIKSDEPDCNTCSPDFARLIRLNELTDAIKKDINNIGSIYPSIGQAMYDEPRERLASMIAYKIVHGKYHA